MVDQVPKEVDAAIEKLRSASERYGAGEGSPALMRVDAYTATNAAYIELRAVLLKWVGGAYRTPKRRRI